MASSEIWVVVATDRSNATVLSNTDGSSRVIERFAAANRDTTDAGGNIIHLSDHLAYLPRPTAGLAKDVMAFLAEGASADAYEGLVIIASPAMRRDLRLAMDQRIHDLVIAEILEDAPAADFPTPALFRESPARRAAGSDARC